MVETSELKTVYVQASVAVYGFRKGGKGHVALTRIVQTLLDDGKLVRVDDELPQPEPESENWYACPTCRIERTDYVGPDEHLSECPNCGSTATPVPNQLVGYSGAEIVGANGNDPV